MLKKNVTLSALLLALTFGALAMPAHANQYEFVCTHDQRKDYWLQNKNPVIYSNGKRVQIEKNYGGPANAPFPTEVVSLDGLTIYRVGGYVGVFGGVSHYQVCTLR